MANEDLHQRGMEEAANFIANLPDAEPKMEDVAFAREFLVRLANVVGTKVLTIELMTELLQTALSGTQFEDVPMERRNSAPDIEELMEQPNGLFKIMGGDDELKSKDAYNVWFEVHEGKWTLFYGPVPEGGNLRT